MGQAIFVQLAIDILQYNTHIRVGQPIMVGQSITCVRSLADVPGAASESLWLCCAYGHSNDPQVNVADCVMASGRGDWCKVLGV